MKNCEITSVRPKIRTKQLEKAVGEPLDKRTIRFEDRDGIERYYPALHIKFSYSMVFTKYSSPPFEAMADLKLREQNFDNNILVIKWRENTNAFEEMIKTLLRLQHNQFWSTLVHEKSLQICLESYLASAPRDYDSNSFLLSDSMKMQIRRVHSLVFKLYHRICSSAESRTSFISDSTFATLLYDNYIIDVPKIFDLSVLYSNTNSHQLLSQLLSNILRCQPKYEEDLHKGLTDVYNELCNLRFKFGIDDNRFEQINKLSHLQWHELKSFVFRVTDIAVSLRTLLQTLPQTAQLFRIALIDKIVVEFYNKVFPCLQNDLNARFAMVDNDVIADQVRRQVMIARSQLILIFRILIEKCFLDKLMDKGYEESKVCLTDEFIECLTSASFERSFIHDYCSKYPLDSDLSELSKHSECTEFENFDKTRIVYLKNVIQSSISSVQNSVPSEERKTNGFVEMEDIDEIDVELESNVQYIREIMPELGAGFISMCLQHFNHDNETTLNAILEDNLPKHLAQVDRTLAKAKRTVVNNVGQEVNGDDRSSSLNAVQPMPQVIDNRQNVYNNDEFDIFRNKNVDLSRIYLGKKEKNVSNLKDEDKEKIMAFHYRQLDEEENQPIDYDDEYDDTYEDDTQIDLMTDKCADELDTKPDKGETNESNDNRVDNRVHNRDNRNGKDYNQRYNRGRSRHYNFKHYK